MVDYYRGALDGREPTIHPDAWIAPNVVLVGAVTVGRASSVWYGSVLRGDDDEIIVGEECNIQDQSCLHADEGEPAILDDRASLGHKAMVHGAHIGSGALIGIGAVVLGRARVGEGALVAAGAVVTPGMEIPAGTLAAGVPAKVIRELNDADRDMVARTPQSYVKKAKRHAGVVWSG